MAKAFPLLAIDSEASLAVNAPLMLHIRLAEMYRFAPAVADVLRVEELHNMRIAAKRLRYTMEIFAPIFSVDDSGTPSKFDTLYEQVKNIQEQIGDIHDCDVRIPLLNSFLEAEGTRRPEIRIGIEKAVRAEQAKRNKLFLKFRGYWNGLEAQGFHRQFLESLIYSLEFFSAQSA